MQTPKGYVLKGLWFGPIHPTQAVILIHGLGSTVFSNHDWITPLANATTAVLVFNNRGHDFITSVRKIDKRKRQGYTSVLAGAAHEIFTDSSDDIEGVVRFVRQQGVKHIVLAGHSTGSQKVVYYITRSKNQKCIEKIILLSPVSDYAGLFRQQKKAIIPKALAKAKKLVALGKPHELLPNDLVLFPCDAQRYLSLYTPNSIEEIFSYSQPKKVPVLLHRIRMPTLVILAQHDEYWDRPVQRVAAWFDQHLKTPHQMNIIAQGGHAYPGKEKEVGALMEKFINAK